MSEIFSLREVSYQYKGGTSALVNVTLSIQEGESVALLGANGSGKSTLLMVMAGLISPTSGEVVAFGEPLSADYLADECRMQAFRRRVGIVFQSSDAQLFSPNVREEIAFGPLHLDLPENEVMRRVTETLRLLGLQDLAERAPYNLSGGEKKKVALAATLSTNPEVLMLDEPTSGLDPRTQHWLVELLGRLHLAGRTLVIATHRLETLHQFADRAVVLSEDHRVVATGPVEDVRADRNLLVEVNLIHPRSPAFIPRG